MIFNIALVMYTTINHLKYLSKYKTYIKKVLINSTYAIFTILMS